jgi:hypothetical protein
MNTITEDELLKYFYKDATSICESLNINIDENYNLVGENKELTKPKIDIDDTFKSILVIKVQYKIHKEHDNIIEIKMSKPKCILRGKELYEFQRVVK